MVNVGADAHIGPHDTCIFSRADVVIRPYGGSINGKLQNC